MQRDSQNERGLMTPADFRATLDRLGLSQLAAARLLRVTGRVVRMWVAGDRPVPFLVARVLTLLASGKLTPDDLA